MAGYSTYTCNIGGRLSYCDTSPPLRSTSRGTMFLPDLKEDVLLAVLCQCRVEDVFALETVEHHRSSN